MSLLLTKWVGVWYILTRNRKLVKWSKCVMVGDNLEREERILDAAAELIPQFGYDKTTVSDIARQAGISKGAIYLHFESKDALFEALLVRELQLYMERWLGLIDDDPRGGTIAGMYKNSLYALSGRPFMMAMFAQDREMLGNYLRKPDNFFRRAQESRAENTRYLFVKMMQEAGLMRLDLDARVIAHIMDIVAHGLVTVGEVKPAEQIPPLDAVIEGIAEVMERALTPENADPEKGKEIVRQIADAGRKAFLDEMDSAE